MRKERCGATFMGTVLRWTHQIHTTPDVEHEMQYTELKSMLNMYAFKSSAYKVVAEYHLMEGGINNAFVSGSVFKLVNATLKIA